MLLLNFQSLFINFVYQNFEKNDIQQMVPKFSFLLVLFLKYHERICTTVLCILIHADVRIYLFFRFLTNHYGSLRERTHSEFWNLRIQEPTSNFLGSAKPIPKILDVIIHVSLAMKINIEEYKSTQAARPTCEGKQLLSLHNFRSSNTKLLLPPKFPYCSHR